MTQFHEGQDVEVYGQTNTYPRDWRKAKIRHPGGDKYIGEWWYVQFPSGDRGCFAAEHIREINPDLEHAPERLPGGGFL